MQESKLPKRLEVVLVDVIAVSLFKTAIVLLKWSVPCLMLSLRMEMCRAIVCHFCIVGSALDDQLMAKRDYFAGSNIQVTTSSLTGISEYSYFWSNQSTV
jgi:hypothetical protein